MKELGARRWWALGALVLSVMAIGLDQTVLNLALPTLSTSLKASESQLQWFVTSYTLALAAAMLPAGLMGDRYGRKTVLVGALALFGVMSVACAFAPSAEAFIAARAVLGVAGAALIVMSLSVVTVLFSEAERPRAIGIWSAGNFLALPLGPIVGGYVLAHFWWGWVFLMNVPVVLVGLVAAGLFLPQSRSERRPGIDFTGVILSSAGLALLMYGLVQAGDNGWGDSSAIVPSLAGIGALVAFFALGGSTHRPARRRAADRHLAVPLPELQRGASSWPRPASSGCSACSSPCRSTCRRSPASTPRARACGSCRPSPAWLWGRSPPTGLRPGSGPG